MCGYSGVARFPSCDGSVWSGADGFPGDTFSLTLCASTPSFSVRLTVYPYLGDKELLQRAEKEKYFILYVLIFKSPSLRPKDRSSRGTIDDEDA